MEALVFPEEVSGATEENIVHGQLHSSGRGPRLNVLVTKYSGLSLKTPYLFKTYYLSPENYTNRKKIEELMSSDIRCLNNQEVIKNKIENPYKESRRRACLTGGLDPFYSYSPRIDMQPVVFFRSSERGLVTPYSMVLKLEMPLLSEGTGIPQNLADYRESRQGRNANGESYQFRYLDDNITWPKMRVFVADKFQFINDAYKSLNCKKISGN